ncbi:MAG: homoserine dehydrogenase [Anaerolineae bacterium]|nr:homoserine dehydrogenase [Anaerolineae bacterium]MDW8100589.1 homoserine dehydrogenase [Anaerolineae bacterium]
MAAAHIVPLIVLGVGGVGRALLRQMIANRRLHTERYGVHLSIVALADSQGAVVEPNGLSDETLQLIEQHKAQGTPLAETPYGYYASDARAIVDVAGRDRAIVVDCTATEAVIPALEMALDRGYGVVLANKKPLTGPMALFRRLTASGRLRHEATVGAGTPIIATLEALLRSGDEVKRIAGALSGTLGFLMTQLESGCPFSVAVHQAHEMGYTEPDPRDDLSGLDVARKALILARMLDWDLELADVAVEPLFPPSLASGTVDEFLAGLRAFDAELADRMQFTQGKGQTLRYVAEVAGGRCVVGLCPVSVDSPLGRLRGSDNLAEFHTRWYTPDPLVLQGRGAGVEATAAGVLSDIVALARCMR